MTDLTSEQRTIVRSRWLDQGKRYDALWRNQRLAHHWFRVPIIIGAATVPVLAGLNVSRVATALVGLMVAVLTGLDSFLQYGVRWRQQRRAATVIGSEGWAFLELSGRYRGMKHAAAYPDFLKHLEALLLQLELSYLELFHVDDSTKGKHGEP